MPGQFRTPRSLSSVETVTLRRVFTDAYCFELAPSPAVLHTQALPIKTAWGGRERCRFDHRDVVVDELNFLILNETP